MYPKVYKEVAPHQDLRQYIKCYWMFEKEFQAGQFERVYPDSAYELIYMRTGAYRVGNKALPRLFMVGQLNKPVDFAASGLVRFWAVRFYPWGLKPFGNPGRLLDEPWVTARAVMGKQAASELATLLETASESTLAPVLDAYFSSKLPVRQSPGALVGEVSQKLLDEGGNIKIQALAAHCCVSQRQLEREVALATGKTPKEIASRLRFEQARDAIMHNPGISLSQVARDYGYNDQSHLTKEFKKYTDITPSAYADIFRRFWPQMQDTDNVVFLQDGRSS